MFAHETLWVPFAQGFGEGTLCRHPQRSAAESKDPVASCSAGSSTSLGMTETGPASIFLLLEPISLCTTSVRNEIQLRCGYSRRRPQRSRVGRLPGARGVRYP